MDHVDGQEILGRKCCKPSVEHLDGCLGVGARWLSRHHLGTVNPAIEPLRAGTAFGSGAAEEDIACNFAEFHEIHAFGMLFLLEKFALLIGFPSSFP